MEGLGITAGPLCADALDSRDRDRIVKNVSVESAVAKKKRRSKARCREAVRGGACRGRGSILYTRLVDSEW